MSTFIRLTEMEQPTTINLEHVAVVTEIGAGDDYRVNIQFTSVINTAYGDEMISLILTGQAATLFMSVLSRRAEVW